MAQSAVVALDLVVQVVTVVASVAPQQVETVALVKHS
jgi:hypothetical protein